MSQKNREQWRARMSRDLQVPVNIIAQAKGLENADALDEAIREWILKNKKYLAK